MGEPRKGLVERLFAEHRRALQTFFYRRIRTKSDAPDLALNAGYQVHVDARGVLAQPTPVDVQQTVAWLQGKIAFEQRPLGEVAEEFNRYGSIPIEIDDAALRALPISGVFDAHDIDSFLAFLQTLDGVRVERTDARIRVFSVMSHKE